MIAYSNLPRIQKLASSCEKVLDVGGGRHVLPYATHVLDLEDINSDNILDPIDDTPFRFSAETWIQHDVCEGNFPFDDKFFDFSFCSHLLEDVRDPVNVCREIIRTSKAGYIEVPSRVREIFAKSRYFRIKSILGTLPEVGFPHHRWFVDIRGDRVSFTAKNGHFFQNSKNFLTRAQVGRKLSADESASYLFWENSFEYEEKIFIDGPEFEADLLNFRNQALQSLKSR